MFQNYKVLFYKETLKVSSKEQFTYVTWHLLSHPKILTLKIPSLDFLAYILKPFDILIEDRENLAVAGLQKKQLEDLGYTFCTQFLGEYYQLLRGEKQQKPQGKDILLLLKNNNDNLILSNLMALESSSCYLSNNIHIKIKCKHFHNR